MPSAWVQAWHHKLITRPQEILLSLCIVAGCRIKGGYTHTGYALQLASTLIASLDGMARGTGKYTECGFCVWLPHACGEDQHSYHLRAHVKSSGPTHQHSGIFDSPRCPSAQGKLCLVLCLAPAHICCCRPGVLMAIVLTAIVHQ